MLDKRYFEELIKQQLGFMEARARLTIHVINGPAYLVHSLFAAHDQYVILRTHGNSEAPPHSDQWRATHPGGDPDIQDQVVIPYNMISHIHLTARMPKGEARRAIGFQSPQDAPPPA